MNTANMTNEQLQEVVKQQQVEMEKLRKERDRVMNQRTDAEAMASQILHMPIEEVQEVLEMEYHFEGTIERAVEVSKEIGATDIHFADFIRAAKEVAIDTLGEEVSDGQKEALYDMVIQDNSVAWGTVQVYGDSTVVLSEQAQQLFADYVRNGKEEYKEEFIEQAKLEQ